MIRSPRLFIARFIFAAVLLVAGLACEPGGGHEQAEPRTDDPVTRVIELSTDELRLLLGKELEAVESGRRRLQEKRLDTYDAVAPIRF